MSITKTTHFHIGRNTYMPLRTQIKVEAEV